MPATLQQIKISPVAVFAACDYCGRRQTLCRLIAETVDHERAGNENIWRSETNYRICDECADSKTADCDFAGVTVVDERGTAQVI